ncbi:MAG: hypothetical protein U0414_20045 [Polyangiaceae bacterium]
MIPSATSRASTFALLFALASTACGSPQSTTGAARASASGSTSGPIAGSASASAAPSAEPLDTTVYERIQKEAGGKGDVLLVVDPGAGDATAIVAMSANDPTRRMKLYGGNVSWLIADPYTHVLWFGANMEKTFDVRMLDLDGKSLAPELVVSVPNDPNCVGWADVKYPQGFASPPPMGAVTEGDGYGVMLHLEEATPRLELVWVPPSGMAGEQLKPADRTPAPRAELSKEIVARLGDIAKRAAGKKPLPAPTAQKKKVTMNLGGCEPKPNLKPVKGKTLLDEVWCGDAEALEGTSFVRVVTGITVGAGTHARWRIYDETGKLPADQLPEFSGVTVSPSGRWAFIDGGLVDMTTLQLKLPDVIGTFLDGGIVFPERYSPTPELR